MVVIFHCTTRASIISSDAKMNAVLEKISTFTALTSVQVDQLWFMLRAFRLTSTSSHSFIFASAKSELSLHNKKISVLSTLGFEVMAQTEFEEKLHSTPALAELKKLSLLKLQKMEKSLLISEQSDKENNVARKTRRIRQNADERIKGIKRCSRIQLNKALISLWFLTPFLSNTAAKKGHENEAHALDALLKF